MGSKIISFPCFKKISRLGKKGNEKILWSKQYILPPHCLNIGIFIHTHEISSKCHGKLKLNLLILTSLFSSSPCACIQVYIYIYVKKYSQILVTDFNDSSELPDLACRYRLCVAKEEFMGDCIFTPVLNNLKDLMVLKISIKYSLEASVLMTSFYLFVGCRRMILYPSEQKEFSKSRIKLM